MKVYALVGKSGTGKSYQAMNLCKEKNIESIVDDGLYIYKADAMAGVSAKRQPTKMGAVRTALFTQDEHKEQVKEMIKSTKPKSILLIGTSDKMVEKIQTRLELGGIDEKVYIQDITTSEERRIAEKQRMYHGKHVVPVPTFQLKRQFSGYFMDPLRIFKKWGFGKDSFSEKSVVRPTYSYLGNYVISDRVLSDIITEVGRRSECVDKALKVNINNNLDGIEITVYLSMDSKCRVLEKARIFQKKCAEILEEMTAFNIDNVNIEVKALV